LNLGYFRAIFIDFCVQNDKIVVLLLLIHHNIMCNWFKKLFGSKCSCDHCGCCAKKGEEKKPAGTVKAEAAKPENAEKKQ